MFKHEPTTFRSKRNLLREFQADHRMSPVKGSPKSLVGDWAFEWDIQPHILTEYNVAPRLGRVRCVMTQDGPHGSGRILKLSSPNAPFPTNRVEQEIGRGFTLTYAYDLLKELADPKAPAEYQSYPLDVFAQAPGMSGALLSEGVLI